MARVKSSTCNGQGAEKKCGRCGKVIAKGEKYTWAKPGFRTRRPLIRCSAHPFRQSELTTGVRSEALAAVEAWDDALDGIGTFDELVSAKDDLESALDDYASTRQEALDAWPNGNSQLEEYVYQAEAARDEVAGLETEYDDQTEPEDEDLDELHDELGDEPHSRADLVELWLQGKLDEVKQEWDDVVQGLDL